MRTAPWLLIIACVTAETVVARQPPPEPASTVRRLHQTMIKTASDVVFNAGSEAPTHDEEWTAIANAGATLVKSGNLLRLASPPKRGARWIALCRQLATAGRAASRAAEARNVDGLMQTSDRLVTVCETCHASYRKQSREP